MEEFVAYIVKNLVDDPESVKIRSTEDETNESIKLEIHVAPEDIGKIIGRRGNTIHALRTILRRVCARLKKKIQIDLVQPDNGEIISTESFADHDIEASVESEEEVASFEEMTHGCCGSGNCGSEANEEPEQVFHSCGCCHHH